MRRARAAVVVTTLVAVLTFLMDGAAFASAATGAPPPRLVDLPAIVRVPLPAAPPPLPLDGENPVTGSTVWWSWSLLDRRTGEVWGSQNQDEGSRTASMVKAWLAALYLRENPEPTQKWLTLLSVMIRDSDNTAADATYRALGGSPAVTDAMAQLCGVSASVPVGRSWASTTISARQQALLGACIADGAVADATWTAWVLDEMRQVRGVGDFGVREAFPEGEQSDIAIKNGWTNGWGDGWWVNCLAIGETWVLVVETRDPSFEGGADGCYAVAEQLLIGPSLA